MLITAEDFEAIASGQVDTAFRRWVKPTVKAGETLTTAAGILAIDAVDVVGIKSIEPDDLARAGFGAMDELNAMLGKRDGTLYRIRLRYLGENPRIALSESETLTDAEFAEISDKLARMDGGNPWTRRTIDLIDQGPGVPAQELAETLGIEKTKFKNSVRRLKALGLTESQVIGYNLSPRGRAWLTRASSAA